jgi:hypothetical protein
MQFYIYGTIPNFRDFQGIPETLLYAPHHPQSFGVATKTEKSTGNH